MSTTRTEFNLHCCVTQSGYRGVLLLLLLCLSQARVGHAEVFTLGYLTGSQRRPGNLDYQRPGITISGAISLAVEQVNAGRLGRLGHSLEFVVAETYGDEVASIRQTAALWTQQVAAYIGPQETCVHEGRMAAAFNLPMISYVSWWSLKQITASFNCSSLLPLVLHTPRSLQQTRLSHIRQNASSRYADLKISGCIAAGLQLDASELPLPGRC